MELELKRGDSVLYEGKEYIYQGECLGYPADCHIALPGTGDGFRIGGGEDVSCIPKKYIFTFANWVRLERKKAGYGA